MRPSRVPVGRRPTTRTDASYCKKYSGLPGTVVRPVDQSKRPVFSEHRCEPRKFRHARVNNPIIRAMRGVLRVRDSKTLRDQKEIREFLGTASRVHFSRGHLKKRTGTSVMRTRRRAPQPDARAHSRVRDGDASQLRIKPRARCFFRRLNRPHVDARPGQSANA